MVITVSQIRDELADREAIKDCLCRFSRGVDRCDEEMLRSAFWEDATDEHMTFKGTREELIAWMLPIVRTMDQLMHLIGNMLIRIDGAKADVESYFYAFHRIPGPDGKPRDTIGSGRYLDKFERRGDEWRIIRRVVITDWFRDYPDSGDWEVGPLGMKRPELQLTDAPVVRRGFSPRRHRPRLRCARSARGPGGREGARSPADLL